MLFAARLHIRLQGYGNRCRAGGYAEFLKNVLQMFIDGSRAAVEDDADFLVGFAAGDPHQNFGFPERQLQLFPECIRIPGVAGWRFCSLQ